MAFHNWPYSICAVVLFQTVGISLPLPPPTEIPCLENFDIIITAVYMLLIRNERDYVTSYFICIGGIHRNITSCNRSISRGGDLTNVWCGNSSTNDSTRAVVIILGAALVTLVALTCLVQLCSP